MTKTEELRALADALAEYDAEAAHRGVSFEPTPKITAALREYAATMDQEPVAWAIWAVSPEGAASFVSARTRKSNMAAFGHYDSALYAHPPAPTTQEPVAWRWSESGEKRWFPWTTEWDLEKRAQELGCPIQYAYAHPPEAQPAVQGEPVAWHVCSVNSDGSLSLEFAAPWEELAHEHINDAINEHDIDGATSWVVRPVYTHPPAPQRKPLSDEQIWAIYRSSALTGKEGVLLNFARAVLKAQKEKRA